MTQFVWRSTLPAALLVAALTACGGSSSGGASMFIESCTLGCIGSSGGSQLTCSLVNIAQNDELSILFSQPVALSSVNDQTFSINEVVSGVTPVGQFVLDPGNDRRVIFRPLLDFDVNGNPIFGFAKDKQYRVYIPGERAGDPGPFIQSKGGDSNEAALNCTVSTSQPISDAVPGKPIVTVLVDTLTANNVPANNAVNVKSSSTIRFLFNDLMDIGTVVAGSNFISVLVDADGDVLDPSDQTPLIGKFTYSLDQTSLSTLVTFTPTAGMPSGGSGQPLPRVVIVDLDPQIRDLAGNVLANPGQLFFLPQVINYTPVILPGPNGESFTSTALRDTARTGAEWGTATSGQLTPGVGGGSGRLGDLVVKDGQTLTLHTSAVRARGSVQFLTPPADGSTIDLNGSVLGPFQWTTGQATGTPAFPVGTVVENHPELLSYALSELVAYLNNNATALADPALNVATYWIENGDTIVIEHKTAGAAGNAYSFTVAASGVFVSGSTLSGGVDGENYVAGNLLDNFDYDASPGGTPLDIPITNGIFEFATLRVEKNGRLVLRGDNPARLLVRGQVRIDGVIDASGVSQSAHPSGTPIGQRGVRGGPDAGSGGKGGDRRDYTGSTIAQLPLTVPFSSGVQNPGAFIQGRPGVGVTGVGTIGSGPGGVQWPTLFPAQVGVFNGLATDLSCISDQVAGPGGGGAYAIDGQPGVPNALNPISSQGTPNFPPQTNGGASAALGIEPVGAPLNVRKLAPKKGHLRGGAGGGGAGTGVHQTATDAGGLGTDFCLSQPAQIFFFRDHSGGGGGGGGGALQLVAGATATIDGLIDASGGDGGSAMSGAAPSNDQGASPGGGGSGGALLMQAKALQITNPLTLPRIDIAGGTGGVDNTGSAGGSGAMGLIRLEAVSPIDMTAIAPLLNPFDALDPTSQLFASGGTWVVERTYPDSLTGAQSCWFRPTGVNFFQLQFADDQGGVLGWDMDILIKTGSVTQTVSYRGPNSILGGGQTYEGLWGTNFKPDVPVGETAAPVVVRFQGARSSGLASNLCNVDTSTATGGIVQGTLTPWVTHPAQLNDFSPKPDMVRFVVLFDSSHTDFPNLVAVTNLRMTASPD